MRMASQLMRFLLCSLATARPQMSLSVLLQMFLKQAAGQKLREAVFDAAKGDGQPASNAADEASHDAPVANLPPCHTGLVFALGLEAAPLEDKLAGVVNIRGGEFTMRHGGLAGRGVVIVPEAVGREKAARATEALIAGHKPKWIIAAGMAGALRQGLKRGDIVMPDVILGETGERLAIDFHISTEQLAAMPGLHVGPLITVDHVILKPAKKTALGLLHGALAVDMETLAVAEVCRREKQRFLAVRVISDTVDDELPADVERLLTRNTTAKRIGAAAGAVFRRPSTVKDLWKLRETATTCATKLAKFLEGVIAQLP